MSADHLVQVEQPQVGVVLPLVLAPRGTHHFRGLRRALGDFQHVPCASPTGACCAPSTSSAAFSCANTPRWNLVGSMNTSGTCFSAFTARVWLSEMLTIMFCARPGGIQRRRDPPDPAVLVAAVGRRGVPVRDRGEVRERRLVVAHTLHDRDLALVVELLHPAHRLVPAELRVDLQEVLLLDADRRPMLVVHRVAVRHDRVQSVVAAEPLEDHQDLARLASPPPSGSPGSRHTAPGRCRRRGRSRGRRRRAASCRDARRRSRSVDSWWS